MKNFQIKQGDENRGLQMRYDLFNGVISYKKKREKKSVLARTNWKEGKSSM